MRRLAARFAIIITVAVVACAGTLAATAGTSPSPSAVPCPGAAPGLTLGTTTPVLLVHGFTEKPDVWTTGERAGRRGTQRLPSMVQAISTALGSKVTVVAFDYTSANTRWVTDPAIGPQLATCIAWLARTSAAQGGPGKVIVVAHSMGGLAVRCALDAACLKGHGTGPAANPDQIGLDITLGTPNLGPLKPLSAAGQFLCGSICLGPADLVKTDAGAAMIGLEPGSKNPTQLQPLPASVPLYAIVGKITIPVTLLSAGPFNILTVTSDIGDGVVPVDSALAGAPPPVHIVDCGTVSTAFR